MRDDLCARAIMLLLLSMSQALLPARHARADSAQAAATKAVARARALAHRDESQIAALARRARKAAWLPNLRVRFGLGSGALTAVRDSASGEYFTATATDAWRLDVEASWSLDRLLYHPAEARLAADRTRAARERRVLVREILELGRRLDAAEPDERAEIESTLDALSEDESSP